ncbi:hypothetical protein DL771_007547 [Monosporascus sp. 5C6A]|nr:hypothetical protein DL771_007547 [Monosporascus sp. 5C6A]
MKASATSPMLGLALAPSVLEMLLLFPSLSTKAVYVHTSLSDFIRAPFADNGLIPIPPLKTTNSTTDEAISLADDYVMLSDIFPTGWTALDYAGFRAGDSVALFGAGPVGLMAAYSAIIRGASTVYSVDYVPERLRLAESLGAVPINFREADPVEQILERKPSGVVRSVDAVGYEQFDRNLTVAPATIIHNMLAVHGHCRSVQP